MREQLDEKIKLYETLRDIPFISGACAKTGIPRSTVYRWLNEDAVFKKKAKKAISRGNEMVNDIAYGKLIQKMKEGYFPALTYHLSRRHPYYRKKNDGVNIKIEQKKESLSESDWEGIMTKIYSNLKFGNLPKKIRKKVVKQGMNLRQVLEEEVERILKETGIDLSSEEFSKVPWDKIMRNVLEKGWYDRYQQKENKKYRSIFPDSFWKF